MKVVSRVDVRFQSWGSEIRVTYSYKGQEILTPGAKKRLASSVTMARAALQRALADLDAGAVAWGGNGTDMTTSTTTDAILAETRSPRRPAS